MLLANKAVGVACAALTALLTCGAHAQEQNYPNRYLRILTSEAGSTNDIVSRVLARHLHDKLGQTVVVENRGGPAADVAARAPGDGYTLLLYGSSVWVLPYFRRMNYDPVRDLAPVSSAYSQAIILLVHPSLPVKSVKELIALAKAKPGQIDYASSGNGSTQHLTGALFASMAGINITHIPYRGSGPVTADLLGGQVMVAFPGIAGMLPHIKNGKLRPLGVSGSKRSPELPNVPTIAEAGVKGYEMVAWFGVSGPKGLSRDIQMKLHGELLKVLKTPEMSKSLQAVGQEPAWQDTPEKFFDFLKVESDKWAKVVKASGAEIN